MEFHEKLQHLRKQQNLTQEQLAEKLFVSRAAVSKWESGRGYPNLESLKSISKLFGVSIDELLSNHELMELAETENRANIHKMSGFVFGVLDLLAVSFLFLPLFGQREGDLIRNVTLLNYTGVNDGLRILYAVVFAAASLFGLCEIIFARGEHERGLRICKLCSLALCAVAILLFALSRQPYVTVLLFLLFLAKIVLVMKGNTIK